MRQVELSTGVVVHYHSDTYLGDPALQFDFPAGRQDSLTKEEANEFDACLKRDRLIELLEDLDPSNYEHRKFLAVLLGTVALSEGVSLIEGLSNG